MFVTSKECFIFDRFATHETLIFSSIIKTYRKFQI